MWLRKHKTTKVRSVIQWPASSQPWAGPQPHEPEHPPNLLTQNAGVRESWLIPFVSTQSTDRGVVTQRTHPLHAVCGEVSKEGGTVGERHKVSSKTESPETLRALKREGKPPGFTAQRALVLSQHRQALSWAWLPPFPATTPPLSSTTPSLPMLCRSPILAQGC